MSSEQRIPTKPESMPDADWSWMLGRDKRRCWRWEQCQNAPCSPQLDCDHRQPHSLGGDNSCGNFRLACDNWNRRNGIYRDRKDGPDEYWEKTNYWDGPFVPGKLRQVQLLAGWDAVLSDSLGTLVNNRNELLRTVTLLPGFTGIGKTILTVSVLFAGNKTVGSNRPRHRHILLFQPHRTLRDQAFVEWRDDPFDLGLVQSRPVVQLRESYADLAKGPMGADVTVCCPQSLWEVERSNAVRSETEVRDVMSLYDTIIWDECDSANDRVRRLCELAPHALKYWMTASPPMGNQSFLNSCVMISSDAVADYKRALELDQCLKLLPSKITPAAPYSGAEYLDCGARSVDNSAIVGRDHTAFLAAILSTVVTADHLERQMQREAPDFWYSPHIIVRLESIKEIEALLRGLPPELKRLRDSGHISGEGWNVDAVYQGRSGLGLSFKSGGNYVHPFMLAKNNKFGRAKKNSARILLMAEIGTRGINNWPLLYVVDLTSTASFSEILQFNFGRPVRLPNHLAPWVLDEDKKRFIQTVIYSLRDLITNENGETAKARIFRETQEFVHNQLDVMAQAGFLTWDDLADGKTTASVNVTFEPSIVPFSQSDRTGMLIGIGHAMGNGPVDDQTIRNIASNLNPEATGRRLQQAVDYGINVRDNVEMRKREIPIDVPSNPEAKRVISRLRPQESYEIEDLIRFVDSDDTYADDRQKFMKALEDNELIVKLITRALHDLQKILYREAPTTLDLHEDVLKQLGRELFGRLEKYGEISKEDKGAVFATVNKSATELFGVDNARIGGPLDHNAYHVAILGKYRETIIRAALGKLIKIGLCPNLGRVAGYDQYTKQQNTA